MDEMHNMKAFFLKAPWCSDLIDFLENTSFTVFSKFLFWFPSFSYYWGHCQLLPTSDSFLLMWLLFCPKVWIPHLVCHYHWTIITISIPQNGLWFQPFVLKHLWLFNFLLQCHMLSTECKHKTKQCSVSQMQPSWGTMHFFPRDCFKP